ncbi:MAG: 4-(cytidine 5'-diphospho)-2-C-methyl-D-erythritol kinase [Kordiimonas sp.]|nr:4-(cytidine 5'-diphospho)-2-C-methyl-D-erythritol kinase [Kordiimonas sp.]|tara:strand:- start:3737 stop:4645 length:909 start_codon:yes stop_codon:yes gene_type:complete
MAIAEGYHQKWQARAKVNLDLLITGRREDGYHLLDSLVIFPDVGDDIFLAPSAELCLDIQGPFAEGLSRGEDNLVMRAARAIRQEGCPSVKIILQKNLPVASGIGGGSADAAATLRALNEYWQLNYSMEALSNIGVTLGADVPACLRQQHLRLYGVGDVLLPFDLQDDLWIVLVNPGDTLSTPAVFRAWGQMGQAFRHRQPAGSNVAHIPSSIEFDLNSLIQAIEKSGNMLTPAACRLYPDIEGVVQTISQQSECLYAGMSGSGATCFGLFADVAAAQRAVTHLHRASPAWWVQAAQVEKNL